MNCDLYLLGRLIGHTYDKGIKKGRSHHVHVDATFTLRTCVQWWRRAVAGLLLNLPTIIRDAVRTIPLGVLNFLKTKRMNVAPKVTHYPSAGSSSTTPEVPNEISQANVPKESISNENVQAEDSKRTVPSQRFQAETIMISKFLREKSQAQGPSQSS